MKKKIIIIGVLLSLCSANFTKNLQAQNTTIPFIVSTNFNEIDSNVVNLFIDTGQSNSLGRGDNDLASAFELLVKHQIKIYSKTNAQFESLQIGVNNIWSGIGLHGKELGFANYINEYYPNETVYYVKWAKGSTSIVQHLTGGEVYQELWNNYVVPAVNSLINDGKQVKVHLMYSQGESDANTTDAPLYSARFDTWVSLWQSNFGATLPIWNTQILDVAPYTNKDDINTVFDAKSLTETYYNVGDTKDQTNIGDNIHYDYSALKLQALQALEYFKINEGYLQTTLLTTQ